MKTSPEIFLRRGGWDAEAEAQARKIPFDFPGDFADYLRGVVEKKEAEKLDLFIGEKKAGWAVVAKDPDDEKELLIIAAFGGDKAHDLIFEVLPAIERAAAAKGYATVRFHTLRPGLAWKAVESGYRVGEVILRKAIG